MFSGIAKLASNVALYPVCSSQPSDQVYSTLGQLAAAPCPRHWNCAVCTGESVSTLSAGRLSRCALDDRACLGSLDPHYWIDRQEVSYGTGQRWDRTGRTDGTGPRYPGFGVRSRDH